MIAKRFSKNRWVSIIFGGLFGIMGLLSGVASVVTAAPAYAEPVDEAMETTEIVETTTGEETVNISGELVKETQANGKSCQDSLGAIGWLVCPTTGKISEAVDWLYEKIENILVINPVEMKDGSPIYEIWKYMRGITNIVFIIFCLVMVYSQLTGLGITNYGLKKTLPKLIVAAILVNLSFIICSVAVDVSNVIGSSLRGVFTTVEEATMGGMALSGGLKVSEMYSALAGGSALALGAGVIAFETGAIWMLIPTVLGAIVAVVIGLVTIALRQAVVALLIMISPLAMIAYMLPNTDLWFKKWKNLLTKMLVFYPMFSLLFGASSLAGFAIIASATDGFGLLLGVAVQIFPLFFSWSLMKMSGTVLGTINSKLTGLTMRPLVANRAWADSHRQLTRAKYLERNQMPSARLMNFLAYRKTIRENETDSIKGHLKAKYTAMNDAKDYSKDGDLSKRGLERYNRQALTMRYSKFSQMHKDNLEKGFGDHAPEYKKTIADDRKNLLGSRGVYSSAIRGRSYEERIKALDKANMDASDELKAEIERGAEIEYYNNRGFFERTLNAKLADGDQRALLAGDTRHQMHPGVLDDPENLARYERFKKIMEGRDEGIQTVLAGAASSAHAQAQIRRNKFQAAADLTPATQNVADHIHDLVMSPDVVKNIDAIIGGLRILNMRGDTDMIAKELEHELVGILSDNGNIKLGTYASQAIANYAMFDVKDNDPVLRRFGKYINMQTAALYNDNAPEKRRTRKDVSWWEYINSEYVERDENDNVAYDENGDVVIKKTRGMRELLPGTSYSRVERTAYKSQREGVRAASYEVGSDGKLSPDFSLNRYLDNMDALYDSTLANIIGDQFAYLSGSEQIKSLAKDLTGVGKDGKWDWKYIFGEELEKPTLEQKAEYIMRSRDLVKKFLGGHVPSQIARSKTDMLQAIESQYALFDEVIRVDDDGKETVDLERLRELEERRFADGDENTPGSYKNFLQEKRSAVKKRFQESFKEEAVKGFAKQFMKGYQGEAKDLLIKLLDPEALYDQYYRNHNRPEQRTRNDEEEEGMPVGDNSGDTTLGGGIYNDTRERIREIFESYRGIDSLNVGGCWGEIKNVLEDSAEMGDQSVSLARIEDGLSQYTDVSQLYFDIMRDLFGDD